MQVGLVQAGSDVPADIQIPVLRALTTQLQDRSRHGIIVNSLSSGGQSGLLSRLVETTVAKITADPPQCSVSVYQMFDLL